MSDNIEPISAKLRRWADESEDTNNYPTTIACKELGYFKPTAMIPELEMFRHIADEIDREKREITERYAHQSWMNPADTIAKLATGEIEWAELRQALDRYYLPRPLFEDGEPVQLGDRYLMMNGTPDIASSFAYTKGDADYVRINGHRMELHERVKRPKQHVLDADGVPIEVGDTLWSIETGAMYIVEKMGSDGCYDCHEMIVRNENDLTLRAMGRLYTHREPDSQERIDADVPKSVCNYFGASGKPCDECPIHGSEIGCSNEKVRDLLRRQRELDGRDA